MCTFQGNSKNELICGITWDYCSRFEQPVQTIRFEFKLFSFLNPKICFFVTLELLLYFPFYRNQYKFRWFSISCFNLNIFKFEESFCSSIQSQSERSEATLGTSINFLIFVFCAKSSFAFFSK